MKRNYALLASAFLGLTSISYLAGAEEYKPGYCNPYEDFALDPGGENLPVGMSHENVYITSAVNTTTNVELIPQGEALFSTNCAGVYDFKEDEIAPNNGYAGTGTLNGEDDIFAPNPGAFITDADLQDLNPDDEGANDPGWFTLFKTIEDEGFKDVAGISSATIAQFIEIDFKFHTDNDVDGQADDWWGEWSITFLDPQGLLQQLSQTSLGDSFFDHLSFTFFGGNKGSKSRGNKGSKSRGNKGSKSLIFYDFDFNIVNYFTQGAFDLSVPHNLKGGFDVSWLFKDFDDLSHISMNVRDPKDVPAPFTLALLGLGMLLLSRTSRKVS